MSRKPWLSLLLPMICLPGAFAATALPGTDKAACEVWQRELSFARSVQQHNTAAFASHIATDAVFDANTGRPVRGSTAIVKSWAAIIAGRTVQLSWYPQHVVAAGDGNLAYSSGAYLFEDPAPKANPRYTIGKFSTVWRRDQDGVWRVTFDGGDEGKPASDAEAAAFHAGLQLRCPAGAGKG
ncbi:YybH family protein [Rhodanobacter koreensis]